MDKVGTKKQEKLDEKAEPEYIRKNGGKENQKIRENERKLVNK